MKLFAIFLVLTSTHISFADDVTVLRDVSGNIFLKSASCIELIRQTESLENLYQWSEGSPCIKPQPKRTRSPAITCSMDITACLPAHIRKYHGVNPAINGPNCWNLSLVMAGILPALRYSTPEEMHFFLSSPLCRWLDNNEPRRPGDIGAIREKDKTEVHGFIYISEDLTYSKNGYSKRNPYALQTLSKIYKTYDVHEVPQRCLANQMDSDCQSGTDFFRCLSMKEYLEKNEPTSHELIETFQKLDNFECQVSDFLFSSNPVSNQNLRDIGNAAEALTAYLDKEIRSKPTADRSQKETFILGALKLRLDAMAEQLEEAQFEDLSPEERAKLDEFVQMVEKSKLLLKEEN